MATQIILKNSIFAGTKLLLVFGSSTLHSARALFFANLIFVNGYLNGITTQRSMKFLEQLCQFAPTLVVSEHREKDITFPYEDAGASYVLEGKVSFRSIKMEEHDRRPLGYIFYASLDTKKNDDMPTAHYATALVPQDLQEIIDEHGEVEFPRLIALTLLRRTVPTTIPLEASKAEAYLKKISELAPSPLLRWRLEAQRNYNKVSAVRFQAPSDGKFERTFFDAKAFKGGYNWDKYFVYDTFITKEFTDGTEGSGGGTATLEGPEKEK